jgi:hypothetical protein
MRLKTFLLATVLLLVAVGCVFFLLCTLELWEGVTRFLDVSLRTRSVWERFVFHRDGLRLFLGRPLNGWGDGRCSTFQSTPSRTLFEVPITFISKPH